MFKIFIFIFLYCILLTNQQLSISHYTYTNFSKSKSSSFSFSAILNSPGSMYFHVTFPLLIHTENNYTSINVYYSCVETWPCMQDWALQKLNCIHINHGVWFKLVQVNDQPLSLAEIQIWIRWVHSVFEGLTPPFHVKSGKIGPFQTPWLFFMIIRTIFEGESRKYPYFIIFGHV